MAAKRIKMPETIRLAGRNFRLEICDTGFKGETTAGQYVSTDSKILLRKGLDEEQMKAVVLHEMFHDFDFQSGFDLTEVQVNSLAALAFAALRDNPKLVAWLMS